MKIFYSGSACDTRPTFGWSEPEVVLADTSIMLSYYLIISDGQKQHLRFPRYKAMKQKAPGTKS